MCRQQASSAAGHSMAWQACRIAASADPALVCAPPASPSPGQPEHCSDPRPSRASGTLPAADGERARPPELYDNSEMTNPLERILEGAAEHPPGKRQRLIAAASQLLHQQGVEKTTLADIAQAADVPVGNIYYYFKTKDELVQAAIDAQAQDIETALASFDRHRSPKARLKSFLKLLTAQREVAARDGS